MPWRVDVFLNKNNDDVMTIEERLKTRLVSSDCILPVQPRATMVTATSVTRYETAGENSDIATSATATKSSVTNDNM